MPTIFSHTAIPIAMALAARHISRRLLFAGIAASIAPDLDTIGFRFGVAYAQEFGHRGFTHSLVFALALAIFSALFAPELRAKRMTAFVFIFVATASHGLLDMFTNGGLGIALFWPFTDARYFFPLRMIDVSPIGLRGFLGQAGIRALQSELLWIWVPALMLGVAVYLRRRQGR
jgi:inner membrane protein